VAGGGHIDHTVVGGHQQPGIPAEVPGETHQLGVQVLEDSEPVR
jgi:hypothetical protein